MKNPSTVVFSKTSNLEKKLSNYNGLQLVMISGMGSAKTVINSRSDNSGGLGLEEFNRRILKDRRRQPTPGLSRYTFWGRRKGFRRRIDQQRGGYVDRYNSILFFFLVLIMGLNILDALLTMMILDFKGWEINPVVRSAIDVYGEKFWIWKFGVVSVPLILLCLHSRFGRVKTVIVLVSLIYFAVVLYQIFLIING